MNDDSSKQEVSPKREGKVRDTASGGEPGGVPVWLRWRDALLTWRHENRRALAAAGKVMIVAAAVLLVGAVVAVAGFWHMGKDLPAAPADCPSRVYAQPEHLAPGSTLGADELEERLVLLEYSPYEPSVLVEEPGEPGEREVPDEAAETDEAEEPDETAETEASEPARSEPLPFGFYRRSGDRFEIALHGDVPTVSPEGRPRGRRLQVEIADGKVASLRIEGEEAEEAVPLGLPLLAVLYNDRLIDCRPIPLDEMPPYVGKALQAAEDANFERHLGLSVGGIVRATFANLRAGEVVQGGSTLTQQLAKNLHFSFERTFRRKMKEAAVAVALDARHSKEAILASYLNHVYWGEASGVNLLGIGSASRRLLGKPARHLSLDEAALLMGMLRSPGSYDPRVHPEAARERRNQVLAEMREKGWISEAEEAAASARPIRLHEPPERRREARHFIRWIEQQAEETMGIELAGGGYEVLATLRLSDQRGAEAAVLEWLPKLEKEEKPLEAALLSVDPNSGAVLAYVGGRDYERSQFDRVAQARRQVGSLAKPMVFAAAFENHVAWPGDVVADQPVAVRLDRNNTWEPRNNDRTFRGDVTLRQAMALSLNVPTVRVAMATGLRRVQHTGESMGFAALHGKARPSMALGAFEARPLEVAQAYATLATGGLRPELYGIADVRSSTGAPVADLYLPAARKVLDPRAAFLVTSMLQTVGRRGTGRRIHQHGLSDPLAVKTGTTDETRDSWFAGYSRDRATVVWVGHDDATSTGYEGSEAALPIWATFMRGVRPPGGYENLVRPAGIEEVVIDPETGMRANAYCPERRTEVFPVGEAPGAVCDEHPADPFAGDPYGRRAGARGAGIESLGLGRFGREELGRAGEAARGLAPDLLPGDGPGGRDSLQPLGPEGGAATEPRWVRGENGELTLENVPPARPAPVGDAVPADGPPGAPEPPAESAGPPSPLEPSEDRPLAAEPEEPPYEGGGAAA